MKFFRNLKRTIFPRKKRVFKSFSTDETTIHLIRYRGKPRIIRPVGKRKDAYQNYYKTKIFYSLFPQHSINPVGVGHIWSKGIPTYGMVTDTLKNRGQDYKKYQRTRYASNNPSQNVWGDGQAHPEITRHENFADTIAKPLAESIREKTGIKLNSDPVNIANVRGVPVFFETGRFDRIVIEQIRKYVEIQPLTKKKKAELLKILVKIKPE